jgi:hypothetical protein
VGITKERRSVYFFADADDQTIRNRENRRSLKHALRAAGRAREHPHERLLLHAVCSHAGRWNTTATATATATAGVIVGIIIIIAATVPT